MWTNDMNTEVEVVGNAFPTTYNQRGPTRRDQPLVELREDKMYSFHNVKTPDEEDPELYLLTKGIEKRGSIGSRMIHNTSSRIKRLASSITLTVKRSQPVPPPVRTNSSVAKALESWKFLSHSTEGNNGSTDWVDVDAKFDFLTSNTDWLLPRSLFGECIGMNKDMDKDTDRDKKKLEAKVNASNEMAGMLFDALRRRQGITSDSINKTQLRDFWIKTRDQSFDSRLQIFFAMVDKDADGSITEKEVEEIIKLSASANKLSTIQNQASEYAALIMEELDFQKNGSVMIHDLEMLLLQVPSHIQSGNTKILDQMKSQKQKAADLNPIWKFLRDLKYFFHDNWKRIWVIALWDGVMAGLFAWKFIQYRNRAAYDVMGHCVSMAKGSAETLKLNMALILMPVCRNTITWARTKTKLGVVVPFNDNLNFHKIIAVAIAIGVCTHTIYHMACDFPRLINASPEKYMPMVQYFGEQPTSYLQFAKSFEVISGIVMVVLMAIAFTFATPWFRLNKIKLREPFNKIVGYNAFLYSHHLFIIVYGLLIAHGIKLYLTHEWYKKTTWMYLAVPMTLYGCERLTRVFRSSIKAVKIQKVAFCPGNVLALQLSIPDGFKYKSGQYMFVSCAKVSPTEWHPFSITSAPGDGYLSFHIRQRGDWTKKLNRVFSEVCQLPPNQKKELRAEFSEEENNLNFPRVMIDGPYGAPAQEYKKYDIVLLVGLGIGATPMISIVKDIMNNIKTTEEEEKSLENGYGRMRATSSSSNQFKTKKAYFYWTTNEPGTFDWFKGIMDEAAEMDNKNVIEMHNYCTSVYEEGDTRSALITMIQSLYHAKNGIDIVSGTRVKCHFAKPNWEKVYKSISDNHPNSRVGVFYCGAPELAKKLNKLALDYTHKSSTKFDFNKENF